MPRYAKSLTGGGKYHELDDIHSRSRCGLPMTRLATPRDEDKPLPQESICPQCFRERKRAEKAAHNARRGA